MTLNTNELIARVRYPYGAFDQTHHDLANALESTVKEMHARELHHFEEEKLRAEAEAKLREAEAVIEKVREIVEPPKPFELGKSMMRSFDRMIGDLRSALATYKPTNQEGSTA